MLFTQFLLFEKIDFRQTGINTYAATHTTTENRHLKVEFFGYEYDNGLMEYSVDFDVDFEYDRVALNSQDSFEILQAVYMAIMEFDKAEKNKDILTFVGSGFRQNAYKKLSTHLYRKMNAKGLYFNNTSYEVIVYITFTDEGDEFMQKNHSLTKKIK